MLDWGSPAASNFGFFGIGGALTVLTRLRPGDTDVGLSGLSRDSAVSDGSFGLTVVSVSCLTMNGKIPKIAIATGIATNADRQ
jgi:hypothetical protein